MLIAFAYSGLESFAYGTGKVETDAFSDTAPEQYESIQ